VHADALRDLITGACRLIFERRGRHTPVRSGKEAAGDVDRSCFAMPVPGCTPPWFFALKGREGRFRSATDGGRMSFMPPN
jgi:hypothetical protein